MSEETLSFQAEVGRLLDIVARSLYSQKEVFLRELISNASDACDRLRYAALTEPELASGDSAYRITLSADKAARTLTIADNGIGMGRQELIDNLGTIARSGTKAFLDQLSGGEKDVSQIGQFGVGFYSAFIVSNRVEVTSRRAGADEAWSWTSDGEGTFQVASAEREERGTTITLHLRDGEDEFLEPERIRHIVKTYSDHIAIPVGLVPEGGGEPETVNAASALWMRPKSEITAEQYKEFYHHVGHSFDDPWLTIHLRAEGTIEYAALLFVPSQRPFDLFNPERRHHLRLYVKRVFITDTCEDLIPGWLRFLRGIVDSEDLPLNVSREMLQRNAVVTRIRGGLVKRVIADLREKSDKEPDAYVSFWENFGAVLKEGLYEPSDHRDDLLALARFHSTRGDALVSLTEYVAAMKDGQEHIYYMIGESLEQLRSSPQLEGFRDRGVEVLLLVDPIDDFWVPTVDAFEGKDFRSASRGGADLEKIKTDGDAAPEDKPAPTPAIDRLIAMVKLTLGDKVKDVRASERLTGSPCCLVAAEGDLDMRLERLLRQHRQLEKEMPRVLELNPRHALIARLGELLSESGSNSVVDEAANLLFDQARIMEGEPVADVAAFVGRFNAMMTRALGSPSTAPAAREPKGEPEEKVEPGAAG